MRDILNKKAIAMAKMNLPEWLGHACPCCGEFMDIISIIGIGVEFSPKMFGNVSVSYVCDKCSSLVELHYVAAMMESMDLASFLSTSHPPSDPVRFEDIVNSHKGNLQHD